MILCGGLKLFLSAGVELGKDEATYVYWGQHLDAPYALFPFALFHWFAPGAESIFRLGPVLFGSASMLLLFRLYRLHPLNVGQALSATAALASTHWIWHTSSYPHPDSPFIACWLLALVAGHQCWCSGIPTVRRLDLLQVGVVAGLTILCKYSGDFQVFGLLPLALLPAPDRRCEAAYSWTEWLCEYRGWRSFAAELEEYLTATEMGRNVPLVSNQYGVAFGLDYYGSGKRTHFTVDDPSFSDLSDLYASRGVDLPLEILFVARARTTLPPSLLSR